jgi:hypothetical protein
VFFGNPFLKKGCVKRFKENKIIKNKTKSLIMETQIDIKPDIKPDVKDEVKKNQERPYNREYWKEEEEQILREWADKAQCYELMHSKAHEIYNYRNTLFVIPVIIISTITGTANFAQDRVPADKQAIFVMVVGAFNILAAIISTVAQYLKISELNESYRVGTLQWGKFYRNIKTELLKHPLDRVPPGNMLSMCKEEFDRLLEIYPNIPKKVVNDFNNKFLNNTEIAKPEICDIMEPTSVFRMTKDERINMIKFLNNIEDKEEQTINEHQGIEGHHLTQSPFDNLPTSTKRKLDKYRQTFFKINNRQPTDEELRQTMDALFDQSDSDNEHDENHRQNDSLA